MSLNIKYQKPEFTLVPAGNHVARLYQIVDLGLQSYEWKGETITNSKLWFTFELCNELKEFDGVMKPLAIGAEYTQSLGDKANLKPIVEGLVGRALSDAERANFAPEDFKKLVGMPCMVNVVHETKGDKTYANIATVTPLPKGMEVAVPAMFNPPVIFDIAEFDMEIFSKLPEFLQKKIEKSAERRFKNHSADQDLDAEHAKFQGGVKYPDEDINPEDIPF